MLFLFTIIYEVNRNGFPVINMLVVRLL